MSESVSRVPRAVAHVAMTRRPVSGDPRSRKLTASPSSLATAEDAKAKAAKAAKMVKKGVKGKLLKKRFSPVFHR